LERSVDADRSAELRRRAMRRAVIDPTEKE
jgi:hypothetical protein